MSDAIAEPLLVTVDEAAQRLRLGLRHVERLVADGILRSVLIGRCRRIPMSELQRFVAAAAEEDA